MNTDLNSIESIAALLRLEGIEARKLWEAAQRVRLASVGPQVYLRGLLEYSNRCAKNCFYCGVRRDNQETERYTMSDEEVLEASKLAFDKGFGSLVIQSGERSNKAFVEKIAYLLSEIRNLSDDGLRVTLSMGEQSEEVYRLWRENGAHRYLLRIEASNPELYRKLHPSDKLHSFESRLAALLLLQKTGYQTGTGVMIGLPFQTMDDLAGDLLFIKNNNIDMVGMGPYVEHHATPLYAYREQLLPPLRRLELSINMVAILRLLMPDINIAATTAMQTLHPNGREMALSAGANVIMPNLTPLKYREGYLLYENKPNLHEETAVSLKKLEKSVAETGLELTYSQWGDSKFYWKRQQKQQ